MAVEPRLILFKPGESNLPIDVQRILTERIVATAPGWNALVEGKGKTGGISTKELDLNGDGISEVLVELPANASAPSKGSLYYLFVLESSGYQLKFVLPGVDARHLQSSGNAYVVIRGGRGCTVLGWLDKAYVQESLKCSAVAQYIGERDECIRAKGTWSALNRAGGRYCLLPTKDGGKACRDSSECERSCVYDGLPPSDVTMPVTGKCAVDNRRGGCSPILVIGGRVDARARICGD